MVIQWADIFVRCVLVHPHRYMKQGAADLCIYRRINSHQHAPHKEQHSSANFIVNKKGSFCPASITLTWQGAVLPCTCIPYTPCLLAASFQGWLAGPWYKGRLDQDLSTLQPVTALRQHLRTHRPCHHEAPGKEDYGTGGRNPGIQSRDTFSGIEPRKMVDSTLVC